MQYFTSATLSVIDEYTRHSSNPTKLCTRLNEHTTVNRLKNNFPQMKIYRRQGSTTAEGYPVECGQPVRGG